MTKKDIRKLLKGNYVKNKMEYVLTDENELFIKGKFINTDSDEHIEGDYDNKYDDRDSFFLPIESGYITKWILKDGIVYLPNTLGRNIENTFDTTIEKFKENVVRSISNYYDNGSSLYPAGAAITTDDDDIVLASDVVRTSDGYILSDCVRITEEDMRILSEAYFGFVELKNDLLCIATQPTFYYELKIKIKPDINRPLFELINEGEINDHHDEEERKTLLMEYLKHI